MNIYRYIFYSIILVAYLIFQTGLKEGPQIWVLFIAVAVILSYHLKQKPIFRIFNLVLITALMWNFVFQTFDVILDWMNPKRGVYDGYGGVEGVMDMSGLFGGVLSLVIAAIFGIANWNINKNKSIQPEYHLAVATLVASGIFFIYFEVL